MRDGKEKMIHISDAVYWDRKKPGYGSANDGTQGAPDGQGGRTRELVGLLDDRDGRVPRLEGEDQAGRHTCGSNAVYDSEHASWYENMGIVMAWVAPKDPHKPEGIDVFEDDVKIDPGVPTNAIEVSGLAEAIV